ncbi:MAG: HD domain-containing protein [Pseudomonadota bacterium]
MDSQAIEARLRFLREAEQLKDTLRSAYTANGRTESTAEHTWRLTLLAMTFADQLPDLDLLRVLKICVLHDLGEAINGDVPAPEQDGAGLKSVDERADFVTLISPLPAALREEFLGLWDEYENGTSQEAIAVKAMDKLETILQHNQGSNPDGFDYAYNLHYGKRYTDGVPLAKQIRELLDRETAAHAANSGRSSEGG